LFFFSCNKPDDDPDDPSGGFDKSAMLQNYADNLIIPGYTSLQQKLTAFQTSADAFLAAPSVGTQADLKKHIHRVICSI
jgi:predicted lipoprotein